MASQQATSIEDVKEIVLEISNNPLPVSVQSDLRDEEKRWLVVGISLHSVITPVLRKFIDPAITKLYKKLKKSYKIDTQTHPNVLLNHPLPNGYNLNYESINNNRRHGKNKSRFDYTVKDPVELSKLFVLPHMAHYTGFNDTCDSSALLGLILNIDKFHQPLKTAADKVRREIRNVWAHCDFQAWDQIKFLQCFQMMDQLVRNLQLPAQEEMETLGMLTKWQSTGHQLLSGTTVGLELLKDIKTEETALAKYLLHVSQSVDKIDLDLCNAADEITKVDDKLSLLVSRMQKLEEEHQHLADCFSHSNQKQECLEGNVDSLSQGQKQLSEEFSKLETNMENVRSEVSSSATILYKRVDTLTERVSKIEYYRFMSRPDKILFYTPDRNKCFVGRQEELDQIVDDLYLNKTLSIQFISGLGGSGKTTFAIEYSWLMHNHYPGGLFWISAESQATFENSLAKLALDAETLGKNSQETLTLTLKWLSRLPSEWLLVVDNVDQEDLSDNMKDLFLGTWRRSSKGNLLVTTRREPNEIEETFKFDSGRCIVLGPMTPDESIDFMLKRTERKKSDENLEKLIAELDGLPLAMEQAAAHIKTMKCSFQEYLERFEKKRLKLSQRRITTTYPVSKERLAVRTTWQINFDYIRKQSEEEGLGNAAPFVMDMSAYFYADSIPEELLNKGAPEIDNDEFQDAMEDAVGVKQVIGILTRFSLFQSCGDGGFQVHRLVQEVIRENILDPKYNAVVIHSAVKMLNAALQNTSSPEAVLEVQHKAETLRGKLHLWSRLGVTACTLRNHINSFVERYGFHKDIMWHFESLKVFQTSAVFHSINHRQAEALSAQDQMLRVLSQGKVSVEQEKELAIITIPIHEKERKRLQTCIESTITVGNEEDSVAVDPTSLRELGNKAFRDGREQDAVQLYSEAIRSSQQGAVDPRLFLNRSLCFLNIQDYERALEDADSCIRLDPSNWKAHCWRAYAVANLIKIGKMPKAMEATGLASASVACHKNPKCKLEFKMKIHYPILLLKVVNDAKSFTQEFETILARPYTTLLLTKGRYKLGQLVASKSIQVIGLEDGVELFTSQALSICPLTSDMFDIDFTPEKELRVHFENIHFVKGGQQILAIGGTTLSFYRCKFSNGREACDDYPQCKGGQGCKNPDPEGCLSEYKLQVSRKGSGHFHTGIGGYAAVSADTGGLIILETCLLDRCGGGGVLSVGRNSVIKVSSCTIQNNRQCGLEARQDGKLIAIDNVIKNNQQHGILIGPYGNAVVQRNYIAGNGREGIFSFEHDISHQSDIVTNLNPDSSSTACIEDNIISHNGLCGISLDGGSFLINSNKILDNWCWGIMAKTRSSFQLTNNDIYNNKCGGLRIGFNYSAAMYLDGNTIRDHTGPHLYKLNFPIEHKASVTSLKSSGVILRKDFRDLLMKEGMPSDEIMQYTSPPIITNRNVFRGNNLRIQHPSEYLVVENVCSYCHKTGKSMPSCTACRKAVYCTKECQVNHWKRHKHFCKIIQQNFTVTVDMKNTRPFAEPGHVHTFDSSLKGIKEGPKPDRKSNKRFIVKIQSGLEYTLYNPHTELTLYDRSVDLDIRLQSPELYHLIIECGVLSAQSYTTKKIFCWASFDKGGKILIVYTDNLPPFQTW